MKVLVVLEAVFDRTPDGRIWSGGIFTQAFFTRYLLVFSQVLIGARVREVPAAAAGYRPFDDPRITFSVIPWYRGLLGYLRHRRLVRRALLAGLEQAEAVIMRIPSPLAGRIQASLDARRRPFAVEVVGDPWEVFAPGVLHHPLRPLLRYRLRAEMRHQCLQCVAAAYVTGHTLQQRYPTGTHTPTFAFSSIELPDEAFVSVPRQPRRRDNPLRLILVATMSQRYKGHDVLLRAIARCKERGLSLHLTLVGDGSERAELERLCHQEGIDDEVRFTGHLAEREAIVNELDRADAFILPSRTEGLPRALIEAMARALPCLGTPVGGIPELLEPDALFPTDDHEALAQAIATRLQDHEWMSAASARNLTISRNYHRALLHERCQQFCRILQQATASWIDGRRPS
jgi:glycosyltransferase involved in cell wall biosynthesis